MEEKIDRRAWAKIVGAGIGGLVVGAAAGYFGKPTEALERIITKTITEVQTKTVTKTIGTPTPTLEEEILRWYKDAAKPYKGVTLKTICESYPSTAYFRDVYAPEFEELTGIKVQVELAVGEVVYEKEYLDMERGTGLYDFFFDDQDFVGTWMKKRWCLDITEFMEEHPELVEPYLDLEDIFPLPNCVDARGHIIHIPFEAYPTPYVIRTDLFTDPKEKEAFKKKYGYDLMPANTWEQYEDIAEFFTRPPDLYGHGEGYKSHPSVSYDWMVNWWQQFGCCSDGPLPWPRPVSNWGINVENYAATVEHGGLVDSPQGVEAMETFLRLQKYAPPASGMMTYIESAEQFGAGIIAQLPFIYSQFTVTFSDPAESKIVGKYSCHLPPVSEKYWKPTMPRGYLDMSGNIIPLHSPHPEAAFLWAQFIISKRADLERARSVGTTVRTSTLIRPEISDIDKKFGGLFSLETNPDTIKYLVGTDPKYGDFLIMSEVIYKVVAKAVVGELSAKECVKELAKTLEDKYHELGYPY